jgi:hypothetical protein
MSDHLVTLDDRWSLWRRFAVRGTGLPVDAVAAFAVPGLLDRPATPDLIDTVKTTTAEAFWSALADDVFLAALTWQNPAVVETWAGRLGAAARSGDRPALTRRNERERVVARYAQRYATKNESIGFFGPVAWGEFTAGAAPLAWDGDLGLRGCSVSFEVWAVTELAAAWAREPSVRPHLPVRLSPACSLRDGRVWRPRRPPVELDGVGLGLLAALAGADRYGPLVEAAARAADLDEGLVAKTAEDLRATGVLQVGFRIPFDEQPERHLRDQVAGIADAAVHADLTARLDRLDAARDRLLHAATDAPALLPAMAHLSSAMADAGGVARRTIARADLGRTAVYPDCRRDLDVSVGTPLLDALRAPLGLLLRAADWIAAEVGAIVEDQLEDRFRRLRRQRETVTLAELQAAATDVLVPGNPIAAAALTDFQLRWAELVPATGAGSHRIDCAAARGAVEALFPARTPGWSAARHHTPDLMLARDGAGPPRWVLGELHVALNTVESRLFATQCEHRADLVAATAADFAGGRVVPLYPPDGVASNSRTYPPPALDPPGAFRYWSFAADFGHEHGHASVPATAVRVREAAGGLVGVADGWSAPVAEFFGEFLTSLCVNMFKLRGPSPHAPRVLFDDVVVCRETWQFPAASVPLPRSRDRDFTYQGLRDWAHRTGLPRYVFVHAPHEVKPMYVDFAAPALLDNMARLLRAAAAEGTAVTVSEMLPGPDQLWLTDAAGRRYTSEFRAVAVRREAGEPVVRPPHPVP